MARSLNIPAIVALHDISQQVEMGESLLLDGYSGLIVVNPSEATLRKAYAERSNVRREESNWSWEVCARRSANSGGLVRHVVLSANIEMPRDVAVVRQLGAKGSDFSERSSCISTRRPGHRKKHSTRPTEASLRNWLRTVIIPPSTLAGGNKVMSSLNLAR
jgi:hypothetical protein